MQCKLLNFQLENPASHFHLFLRRLDQLLTLSADYL